MKHSDIKVERAVKLPPTLAFMLGTTHAPRHAVDAMLERAIGELDRLDGDPDLEDSTDAEDDFTFSENALFFARNIPGDLTAEPDDIAWVEGQTDQLIADRYNEDTEEDDPPGQYDEDAYTAKGTSLDHDGGAGCPIGDPDYGIDDVGHDTRDDDREVEQMLHDVPMLPAVDLVRRSVGIVNLQSSFRANGGGVVSADSGQPYRSALRWDCKELGSPV